MVIRNQVSPVSVDLKASTATMSQHKSVNARTSKAMNEKIGALFRECQEVILVEYIESIVPIFYILYLALLFHLPNAKYYPEMQTMTAEHLSILVRNIAMYASLEFISLIYVHLILKWRFNLSALHLLAFTLERNKIILQGIFFSWVILNLQFTLVHYGKQRILIGIVWSTHSRYLTRRRFFVSLPMAGIAL